MTTAQSKTDNLVRKNVPVNLIHPDPSNPNRMGEKEMNLLIHNMTETGFVDPAFLRPHPEIEGHFMLIGGHHRIEAAKYLGFEEVPATITYDPDMTEEMKDFQLVRMNVIHGNIQPSLFLDLYNRHSKKYGEAVAQDLFGFADEAAFKKLIAQTKKSLPKEMQAKFVAAAKEVKTIDGLASVLNRMFQTHGDTLSYGYMVVDYGGKDSIWLRASSKTHKQLLALGDRCIEGQRSLDSVIGGILQLIAEGKLDTQIKKIMADSLPVEIKDKAVLPTEDNLHVSS